VRELAVKQYRNQTVGTMELIQEIKTIVEALGRHHSPLACTLPSLLC
jgi:hypothetical protein